MLVHLVLKNSMKRVLLQTLGRQCAFLLILYRLESCGNVRVPFRALYFWILGIQMMEILFLCIGKLDLICYYRDSMSPLESGNPDVC